MGRTDLHVPTQYGFDLRMESCAAQRLLLLDVEKRSLTPFSRGFDLRLESCAAQRLLLLDVEKRSLTPFSRGWGCSRLTPAKPRSLGPRHRSG